MKWADCLLALLFVTGKSVLVPDRLRQVKERGLSKAGAHKNAPEPGMTSREAASWPQREDSLSHGSCAGMPLE